MSVEKEEHNIGEIKSSFGKIIVDLENLNEEPGEITFPSGSPTPTPSPKSQIGEKKERTKSSGKAIPAGKRKTFFDDDGDNDIPLKKEEMATEGTKTTEKTSVWEECIFTFEP